MNSAVPGSPATSATSLLARRRAALGSAYRLFYEEPLHVVRGEGAWLYAADGEKYLDAYNNVACVGHCHPHVVAEVSKQLGILNTHTRYLNEMIVDYAERLLGTLPPELEKLMFTCSGSEANDVAIQLARASTGASGVIVTEYAYHGATTAIAGLSPSLEDPAGLSPTTALVPAPDRYRNPGVDLSASLEEAVEGAIAELAERGMKPAALLLDTLFSSDGSLVEPAHTIGPAVDAVRRAGGLFIADEVQAGFGRTDGGMWGFTRHGVRPDIVTMGKPMGNGYPVAGVAARHDILDEFGDARRYFNTFAGTQAAAAAAAAVLDVIEDEGLVANAATVGLRLKQGFDELAARHQPLGDVRGAGLFLGVEIVADQESKEPSKSQALRLINGMRERRVLVSNTGPHGNVLKIRPPLVFTGEQADHLLEVTDEVLAELPDGN